MPKKFFLIYIIAGVGLALLLITGYLSEHSVAIFNPQGIVALKERNLIITALSLMCLIMVPLLFTAYFFAWRYREGNKKARYEPEGDNGVKGWLLWWILPSLVILALMTIVWTGAHSLDPYKPISAPGVKPLTIQVVALDWKWLFIYPEQGIATVNFIQFPQNTPINFQLTADAPMNSFWIPQLGGQIFAMPGMTTQLHLMADSSGSYSGQASEINGKGFSGMKFSAKSTSQLDFNNWVNSVKGSSSPLTMAKYNNLVNPSTYNPVALYSSVDQNLFNSIIMKYMAPSSSPMDDMSGMHM